MSDIQPAGRDTMPTDPRAAQCFWVMQGDRPGGPYDVEKIHELLTAGTIGWQSPACPVGESGWLPLIETPGVGPTKIPFAIVTEPKVSELPNLDISRAISPGNAPALPAVKPPSHSEISAKRPWNPILIAWLGILFTPMWAGVMAAINGKRLQSSVSPWLPLGIGFGFLVIASFIESDLLSWGLYVGAVIALWIVVLYDQSCRFEKWVVAPNAVTGSWVWPSVAGVPLALLVIVAAFAPLEPRTVCEKFVAAKSDSDRETWTTLNLRSSLSAFADKPGTARKHWELLDEVPAPVEFGGLFVVYRLFADAGPRRRTEGLFHLININGDWKIEDVYVLSQDGVDFHTWGRISSNPYLISPDGRFPPPNQNATTPKAEPKATDTSYGSWFVVGRMVTVACQSKTAKAIGIGLIALLAAISKLGKPRDQTVDPAAKS